MILSPGRTLQVPLTELDGASGASAPDAVEAEPSTLKGVERAHIVRALAASNWTIGGPHGAAARLGMKRTTLQSWMKRLGIARPAAPD